MRQFVRHPTDVPISLIYDSTEHQQPLKNVSYGGLCCISKDKMQIGDHVIIRIPALTDEYESYGMVSWCVEHKQGFEVGIEFQDANELYKTRMVEQVCYIEQYRKRVLEDEGRKLSPESAAEEWISKYAEEFAQWTD